MSPFGGLNFVLEELDNRKVGELLNDNLPAMGCQSQYDWRDILYSLWSVFFCGGDCAEDLSGNFRPALSQTPFLKVPSPDRALGRLKQLAVPASLFPSPRSSRLHHFALNDRLSEVLLKVTNRLCGLSRQPVTVDYDNTLCLAEKKDAEMTYHSAKGYCPGVAFVGSNVVYLENRNGGSDAMTLQDETLERMFQHLQAQGIKTSKFRADSASYTFRSLHVISSYAESFYVKARMNEAVARALASIEQWGPVGGKNTGLERGEVLFTPFERTAKREKAEELLQEYRIVATKEKRRDGQVNLFTGEAYQYSVIITNDFDSPAEEVVFFYNQRGTIEKEFDVLKNDFGWDHMPFSRLEQNQVYLQLMALCRNIYHYIIRLFSNTFNGLRQNFRIKKFIFRFIAVPAQWIYKARQWHLRVYGEIAFKT